MVCEAVVEDKDSSQLGAPGILRRQQGQRVQVDATALQHMHAWWIGGQQVTWVQGRSRWIRPRYKAGSNAGSNPRSMCTGTGTVLTS